MSNLQKVLDRIGKDNSPLIVAVALASGSPEIVAAIKEAAEIEQAKRIQNEQLKRDREQYGISAVEQANLISIGVYNTAIGVLMRQQFKTDFDRRFK